MNVNPTSDKSYSMKDCLSASWNWTDI